MSMAARIVVEPARLQDDPALRRILRNSAMPGRVSISYEREPSFFDSLAREGGETEVVVARDTANDAVIGFFTRTVRSLYVNGKAHRVGYLGQLRFDPKFKYRIPVLRKGFDYWRHNMLANTDMPCDLTSILDGNIMARRLLEAGKRGFPAYRPIAKYLTLAMRSGGRGDRQVLVAQETDLPEILTFIRSVYQHRQFAPALPDNEWKALFASGELDASCFLVLRDSEQISGVLAIWDQRACRQAVLRDYAPMLNRLRPLANIAAALTGTPSLPPAGSVISQAFVFLLAMKPGMENYILPRLLRAARREAHQRGIDMLTAGFARHSTEAEVTMRHFRCYKYPSTIYFVQPQDQPPFLIKPAASVFHQELALL